MHEVTYYGVARCDYYQFSMAFGRGQSDEDLYPDYDHVLDVGDSFAVVATGQRSGPVSVAVRIWAREPVAKRDGKRSAAAEIEIDGEPHLTVMSPTGGPTSGSAELARIPLPAQIMNVRVTAVRRGPRLDVIVPIDTPEAELERYEVDLWPADDQVMLESRTPADRRAAERARNSERSTAAMKDPRVRQQLANIRQYNERQDANTRRPPRTSGTEVSELLRTPSRDRRCAGRWGVVEPTRRRATTSGETPRRAAAARRRELLLKRTDEGAGFA